MTDPSLLNGALQGEGRGQPQGTQWQQQVEMGYSALPSVGGSYPPSNYPPQQQQQQQQPSYKQPPTTNAIQYPASTSDEFFHQCEVLNYNLNVIRNNTAQIKDLNNKILGEVNVSKAAQFKTDLDRRCEENSALINETRDGIKILSQAKTPSPSADTKNQQYAHIVKSLKAATREFFDVEAEVKQSARDQFARQYRIARPSASDQEIDAAIETGKDVFSQELMSSRVQEQRKQLDSVQERARALNKIQESMNELLRIVQELDAEIDKQQVFVDEIQRSTGAAQLNVSRGIQELSKGVDYAAAARKKQMWIFIIILTILIVIGVIIAIYVATSKARKSK
ncbi:Plasma membrane t-SNARE, secretory vesicle fusion [Phlyctochytrium planicorne]|nr:Plasma membrane t-SNARE, secretory vesicle fusion [Phlyctochytrium planicorne]